MTGTLHDRLSYEFRRWMLENNLPIENIEIKIIFPRVNDYMRAFRTWKMTTPVNDYMHWLKDRPSVTYGGITFTMDIPAPKCKEPKEQAAL